MNQISMHVREIADAMSNYGYALGQEADSIAQSDLIAIANALQANVDLLVAMAESLPVDSLN